MSVAPPLPLATWGLIAVASLCSPVTALLAQSSSAIAGTWVADPTSAGLMGTHRPGPADPQPSMAIEVSAAALTVR
ncbi:MAG: hypothetical protein H0W08_19450 [Acidobacteria bacterium]|nr:hypothetical protein [Acidobacteriota bacterium]